MVIARRALINGSDYDGAIMDRTDRPSHPSSLPMKRIDRSHCFIVEKDAPTPDASSGQKTRPSFSPSQHPRSNSIAPNLFIRDIRPSYKMVSPKAVLILKGDLAVTDVLDILDHILDGVRQEVGGPRLEPWQLFSLICASGPVGVLAILLGRLRKSTSECRQLVEQMVENIPPHHPRQHEVLSSWAGWSSFKQAQSRLRRCIGAPQPFQDVAQPCRVFIWKPHGDGEPPDHLTSYKYHDKESTITTLEAVRVCLHLRECASIDYPLKSMVQEAKMRLSELHSGRVYISIRVPAAQMGEAISDGDAGKDLDRVAAKSHGAHVPFVLDQLNIGQCAASWPIDDAVRELTSVFPNKLA